MTTASFAGVRALVTGATGFLGANLVRWLLAEDAEVHVILRATSDRWRLADVLDRLHLHAADLTDLDATLRAVDRAAPQLVLHNAATHGHPTTRDARQLHLRESVLGTANLFECLRERADCRTLHVGSSTEYGARHEPLREDLALRPTSFRGASKAAACMFALELAQTRWVAVIRPFSIYGPWESPERFVPTMVRRARAGEPLQLTAAGVRHDFVYVDDVVEACRRTLLHDEARGQILNVGSGVQTTNEEVAALIKRLTGSDSTLELGAHPAHAPDTAYWVADCAQTQRLLGWQPTVTLADGLARTIAWAGRDRGA